MNLLLIFGGVSNEHDISCKSCSNVLQYIDKSKYNIHVLYISKNGEWIYLENPTPKMLTSPNKIGKKAVLSPDSLQKSLILLDDMKTIEIDCIFPVLHGKNGEDGTIQGLFELAKIPYVGCGVTSSANSMDKSITKIIVDTINVPQSPYFLILHSTYDENVIVPQVLDKLCNFPLFVKPCSSGSSVGVSKVFNIDELKIAIKTALSFDKKVLIEQNIEGKEVEVAVLGNDNPKASVVGEIAPSDTFYSYDDKYINNTSGLFIPARIEDSISDKIRKYAIDIYKTLGCSGLSRVDFFLTDDNKIIFNEINTLPGFTNISMYPKLFEHSGIKYADLLDKLINLAINRGDNNG